jgi:crotonobetainyl-CoA:carnitine CoA-transferase CaiB-like acyl-CoA transferase
MVDVEVPMGDITLSAKYQRYQTADGKYILFCCIEPKFWDAFCRVTDRGDLLDRHDRTQPVDFGFDDVDLRLELQTTFHAKSQEAWVAVARNAIFRWARPCGSTRWPTTRIWWPGE